MNKLTTKENQKYITIREYIKEVISRREAAVRLNVRLETASRLKVQYINEGKSRFSHKNHGNTYAVRTDKVTAKQLVALYKTKFTGFNFSHFYEMVLDHHLLGSGLKLPTSRTVFSILEKHGITSPSPSGLVAESLTCRTRSGQLQASLKLLLSPPRQMASGESHM